MAEKKALEEKAAKLRRKMETATRFINSLADNKKRWLESAAKFADEKKSLVGNVAKACAFVSYCGPFNADFRDMLLNDYFQADLDSRNLPSYADLPLLEFLVDEATVGEWKLQGLPSDDLSI